MNRYEQTTIWQRTLAKQLEPDIYEKERDLLRVEFEKFRENARLLAGEISRVLPEFTVHDISHIDALWETAELVTKDDYELTPAEAFVLGGTFLIHDLGMGLSSFPKGIDELKKEPIWIDTAASLLKKKLNRQINASDLLNIDKEIEGIATEITLRLLHAKQAEKLAHISWKNKESEEVFLIDNSSLRQSYGTIIGLIAHSHWWRVEELESKLPQPLGAPGMFPQSWTIDPIKLACILRIADAIQVDDRRAPSFLRTIRKPSNFSDTHWKFQQKLYQPRLERNRLVFTSKSPFTIDEVDSWWVCYDTLKMIDNELKEVDSLLVDTNRRRLKAIGVSSIEDPKRISKLIATEGWQPVDTKIKVTDVAKLVNSIGGKQLYGDNAVVPLRELIQNASDAIRARRVLEGETNEFGDIIIRHGKDNDGYYIEVEDNGIGMSPKVLTGPFLDFGQSFWGTSLMHEELPGLESKGFVSTGQYGIGFFSVFMWGEKVTVASKRFESGRDNTLILEFNMGASSRPILRKASAGEYIKDGGTRVRVWLSSEKILDELLEREKWKKERIKFTELIGTLCPSIDCNIILEEKGTLKTIIQANDWITITPIKLLKRIMGISFYNKLGKEEKKFLTSMSKNMSVIKEDDGNIVGRLMIFSEVDAKMRKLIIGGVVTVGGFRTTGLQGLMGILIGQSYRASRDIGLPTVSSKRLSEWISSQADILSKSKLLPDEEMEIKYAQIVRCCGGNTKGLKIAYHKSVAVNVEDLKKVMKCINSDTYIVANDLDVFNYEEDNSCKIEFLENVFWVEMGIPGVLQTYNTSQHLIDWPKLDNNSKDWFASKSLRGLITETLSEVWGKSVDEIDDSSDISSDDISYKAAVGYFEGKPVIFDDIDIMKKPKKK